MNRRIPTKRDANAGLLKDGIYHLRIEDVEEKTSPNSGNDYLQLRLSVLVNGSPQGRSLWDILSFSDNARFKFDQIFDALNAPEDAEVPITWFKGKNVYAQIATDEYNGNLKNVVKVYLTPEMAKERIAKQKILASANGKESEELPAPQGFIEEEPAKAKGGGKGRKKQQSEEFEVDESMPL